MENIILEYKNLFEKLNMDRGKFSEKEMSVFNARKGKHYKNKLMVVGRAVNGWYIKLTKNANGIIDHERVAQSLTQLSKDINTDHNLDEKFAGSKYNPNRSAFTRVKKALAAKLTDGLKNDEHNSIVWSNLYKISKGNTGNPSGKLMAAQMENCIEILKNEIDFFQPENIIFLTGGNWAAPFLKNMNVANTLKQKLHYVDFAGKYNESYIIVGQHPQTRKHAPHITEILNELSILKGGNN